MRSSMGIGSDAVAVRTLAYEAYNNTVADPVRAKRLDELASRIGLLADFIYRYASIGDPSIHTDEEMINWTIVDVAGDLASAVWNLACGFYKASASVARNAHDLSFFSLACHIDINNGSRTNYCTKLFDEWDKGKSETPNWEMLKSLFPTASKKPPKYPEQRSVRDFDLRFGCNVLKEARDHYGVLCNFTHSRPFDRRSRLPSNSANLGVRVPGFDAACFVRFSELIELTIAWIATMWLLSYPKMLTRQDSYNCVPAIKYLPCSLMAVVRTHSNS